MENVKLKIEKLRDLIKYHNFKYFVEQEPEISDAEYDALFYELRELEEKYPQLSNANSPTQMVGGKRENTFEEVEHKIPMLSLGKCKNFDAFKIWITKVINYDINRFSFEVKFDGLAVSLTYNNGNFIRGVTRGDGVIGEDITATILTIPSIPKVIKNKDYLEIRGEVILLKSGLQEINNIRINNGEKTYENVRNAASGLLRTKKPIVEMGKYLRFGAYMIAQGKFEDSHSSDINYLRKLGFNTSIDLSGFHLIEEINVINEITLSSIEKEFDEIFKLRDNLDFEIDGIVIKVDLYKDQERLGEKSHIPNWATAFKFEAQKKMTKLLGVEHLLGNKGNITPRAILEPVKIGGTTVIKPTLHNYDIIKELDLKIGDYVWVERRGDVIPKVVGVVKELRIGEERNIDFPINCPECNQKLTWKKAIPRCDNELCPGGQFSKIQNWIKALEIEEFGPTLIEKLIEIGKLNDLIDIYNLKIEDISSLERMGEKSAIKVLSNIKKSQNSALSRVIAGLTIKNVGIEMAKNISKKYNTLENFSKATRDELISMDGFGEIVSENIVSWLNDTKNKLIIEKLVNMEIGNNKENNEVKINSLKLNELKFSFTGELNLKRKDVEKIITENNGVVWAIKKELNYLIIGKNSKEEKILKAQKLGAKIINEEEFFNILKIER